MSDNELIFDLGLHKGLDTRNYLAKGFRVVGLEAVPALCAIAKENNAIAFAEGRFQIAERALWHESGASVRFFVNATHDDWGSLERGSAEKGVSEATEIYCETISLNDMVSQYGKPYYIKCDLEGGDAIFAEQLASASYRPPFVSIEATSIDDLAQLRASGYRHFQIINQYMNPYLKAPYPAREGNYVDLAFDHHTSGLFGRELNETRWADFSTVARDFAAWHDLRARTHDLVIGWLDVHAALSI